MNRPIYALQQVARRTFSSSVRRQMDNKEDNGMPVHLKGGSGDAVLYRATMALTVFGAGFVFFELVSSAFPKK